MSKITKQFIDSAGQPAGMVLITDGVGGFAFGNNEPVEVDAPVGDAVSSGTAVFFDTGTSKWQLATITDRPRGMATNVSGSAGSKIGDIVKFGQAEVTSWGLTPETVYYLHDSSAGAIVPAEDPNQSDIKIGISRTAEIMDVDIDSGGSSLTIKDEGVVVDNRVASIDIKGDGATVTDLGAHNLELEITGKPGNGSSFPVTPSDYELFWRTDLETLFIYLPAPLDYWVDVSSGISNVSGRFETTITVADGTTPVIDHGLKEREVLVFHVNTDTGDMGLLPYTYASSTINQLTLDLSVAINAKVIVMSGNGSHLGAGVLPWNAVTDADSPYQSEASDQLIVNTSGGAVQVDLPPSPALGDTVRFIDGAGTFSTSNLTVGRSGENIMGLAQDLVVSDDNERFTLVYYDTANGWRLAE